MGGRGIGGIARGEERKIKNKFSQCKIHTKNFLFYFPI
jgi:hypothetical protein